MIPQPPLLPAAPVSQTPPTMRTYDFRLGKFQRRAVEIAPSAQFRMKRNALDLRRRRRPVR